MESKEVMNPKEPQFADKGKKIPNFPQPHMWPKGSIAAGGDDDYRHISIDDYEAAREHNREWQAQRAAWEKE